MYRDFRFALRLLAKDRGFAFVVVMTIALGIAATATVYTIVNAMVFRGLPVAHADRFVQIFGDGRQYNLSARDVEGWRSATTRFAGLAAYSDTAMTVGDEGRSPEVFAGTYIGAGAFALLGENAAVGRGWLPEDDQPGAPAVVVLGHTVWTTRYGRDPSIVGRTLRINEVPALVVGVMPPGFRFPVIAELWQPLADMPGFNAEDRGARSLRVFGRLADGVTIAAAQAELTTVVRRLARDHPDTNRDLRPIVQPYTGTAGHPMFLALLGSVAFVLLIACANVANLLLARSSGRSREMAIRIALGATRWHIVRQLMVESAILTTTAGAAGLALAALGVRVFAWSVSGINFAYWYRDRWTMDAPVFTLVAAVCLGTAFVFGLVPAGQLLKSSQNDALKSGARTGSVPAARRTTVLLVVADAAFTMVLLAGAGLMMRSFLAIYRADLIVDTRDASSSAGGCWSTSMSVNSPRKKLSDPKARHPRSCRGVAVAPTRHYGPTYVFECPYCQKRFSHSKNDPALRKHKRKDGWGDCPGRRGHLVEV